MIKTQLISWKCACTFLVLFVCHSEAFSQVSPWTVFEVPTDPRSAGLGGRLVASLDGDAHAGIYSPALVDSSNVSRIAFDHVRYFGGMSASAVGYTWGTRNGWTWSTGARFSGYGTFNETNPSGQVIGSFSGGENLLQSTVSKSINSHWRVAARGILGVRNLDRETAGLFAVEAGIHGTFDEQNLAVGAAITGWGAQIGFSGNQPSGRVSPNIQVGAVKGFDHAPFRLHLRLSDLQKWNLAPDGTYDPSIDPLTGDSIASGIWQFGDQLMRHTGIGAELLLSDALSIQLGFDYRRRAELAANGRTGTNGFSIGTQFAVRQFQLRLSRNTYNFAGSSTHLAVNIPLSAWM